jgi:tRNA-Thr(GGU) m(6)t(6)A37 methyltransferase TsaA
MHNEPGPVTAFTYTPIGTIHSPYTDIAGMPIQPSGARGVRGTIEIRNDLCEGLLDLDGFSHIILLYALHRCTGYSLTVTPFLDPAPHGVFATRSPKRPNAIGFSVVRLMGVDGCVLTIENVDILDGTPLLDIKPYVPAFDAHTDTRHGWFEHIAKNAETVRSDDRFR